MVKRYILIVEYREKKAGNMFTAILNLYTYIVTNKNMRKHDMSGEYQ